MKTYKESNYCDLKTAGKENFYEVKSVLNLDLIRPSGKNEILGRKRKDYLAKETWIQKTGGKSCWVLCESLQMKEHWSRREKISQFLLTC